MPDTLAVYIDGGSRGNPGSAGGGFAVYQSGRVAHKESEYFGRKTNNQAEYMALVAALTYVTEQYGQNAEVDCFMDSQLAVEQMNGNYKVKSENVKPLFKKARSLADQFTSFTISHVPREDNALADALANRAMDRGY